MEFVMVRFRESRTVVIDGNDAGPTNETLRVPGGDHTFSLTGLADFIPPEQTVKIENTTQVKPQEVNFA